jgi:hypothetical protein
VGDINVDIPDKIVTPVVETESKLTAPLIEHEGRVTRIEEEQKRIAEQYARDLLALEERLNSATGDQARIIEEKINRIESRLEEIANRTVETTEEVPEDLGVDLQLPEIETSPKPPENKPKGRRNRLKARRKVS